VLGTTPDGVRTIELLGLSTDKTHKLTFGNTTVRQDFTGANVLEENVEDDFCGVRLMYYYINQHLPEGYTGRFFLRRAYEKELRKCRAVGNQREAGLGVQHEFGKNYCNKMCKELAYRVKLDFPEQQTGRSKRRGGITVMCHKLPGGMLRAASRHASAETNARYQTETDESRNARSTAFHYTPRTTDATRAPTTAMAPPTLAPPVPQPQPHTVPVQHYTAPSTPAHVPPPQSHAAPVQRFMAPMGLQYSSSNAPPFQGHYQTDNAHHFQSAQYQRIIPGTPVFPGNVATYQQHYTGNTPQGPPNTNIPGFPFFQHQK
jgi:hypothetical protein